MTLFTKQLLEAAGWTFLEMFVITMAAGWAGVATFDWPGVAALAGGALLSAGAAALSMIKSFAFKNVGTKDSVFISS